MHVGRPPGGAVEEDRGQTPSEKTGVCPHIGGGAGRRCHLAPGSTAAST